VYICSILKSSELKTILIIGLGGFLGSVGRYLISVLFEHRSKDAFPWHTFLANIIGCLILGLIFGYFEKRAAGVTDMKMFLTIGFCGGFTTFSAFTLESLGMLKNVQYGSFFLYSSLSLVLCLLALNLSYIAVSKL